ncbi:MAG: DUF2157 domain-containing protein [Candidatus Andersenbacteria bacterium]
MLKAEAINAVKSVAASNTLSETEVIAAYRSGRTHATASDDVMHKRLGVVEILYAIGGAIVFLGIIILVSQNWNTLSDLTKITVTLGSGLAAYVVGLLFSRYKSLDAVSQAFYLISAVVMPIGLNVTFDIAGLNTGDFSLQTLITALLFAMFFASFIVFRKAIFILFSVIFGTWLFFSLTSWLVGTRPEFSELEFYEYRTLLVGLTYILLGYYFAQTPYRFMQGWLYGFGVLGFLGAALALGGWSPEQNLFWEAIYPGLLFGIIFLSVHVKSKAFLIFGALFLVAYIFKITAEYFQDSLGWPFALVICGLTLIAVGYGTVYLNKRYLGKSPTATL